MTQSLPSVKQLHDAYVSLLRACLTPEQLHEAVTTNRHKPNSPACHTYKLCDTGQIMAQAFAQHGCKMDSSNVLHMRLSYAVAYAARQNEYQLDNALINECHQAPPLPVEVRNAFTAALHEALTAQQIKAIHLANEKLPHSMQHSLYCATHDYLDANALMEQSWQRLGVCLNWKDPLHAHAVEEGWLLAKRNAFALPNTNPAPLTCPGTFVALPEAQRRELLTQHPDAVQACVAQFWRDHGGPSMRAAIRVISEHLASNGQPNQHLWFAPKTDRREPLPIFEHLHINVVLAQKLKAMGEVILHDLAPLTHGKLVWGRTCSAPIEQDPTLLRIICEHYPERLNVLLTSNSATEYAPLPA